MTPDDFVRWLGDILLNFKLKVDKPSLDLIVKLYAKV